MLSDILTLNGYILRGSTVVANLRKNGPRTTALTYCMRNTVCPRSFTGIIVEGAAKEMSEYYSDRENVRMNTREEKEENGDRFAV